MLSQTIALIIIGAPVIALFAWLSSISKKAAEKQAKEKAEQERIESALLARIITTTRGDYVSGYVIKEEIDWVRTEGKESPSFVEADLKLKAARIGANALIKLHWKTVKESVVAGYGKKGNPHYTTETSYSGEGLAVFLAKKSERKPEKYTPAPAAETAPTGYASGWVAIDGNNIFGTIYNDLNDTEEAFRILNRFLLRLQTSPYKTHLFWDNAFIKFARAVKITEGGEKLSDILTSKLAITTDNLTVSDFGKRADETIISWAAVKSAAVISGDNFSKKIDDALILEKSKKLAESRLLLKYKVVAGEIIVPELTSL